MTLASDNAFPSILVTEGTTPATPAAGEDRLFVRSSDHVLCTVNSSGTVTPVGGGGSGSITASGYTQSTAKMLGRSTASTGAIEEITVGSGLTLSGGTLAASGGGGGATVQYGSLKPATPTDDFAASALDGAWSAHTGGGAGSWGTGNVFTQALDGSHASFGFNNQSGSLYRATTNVDQEVSAGGLYSTMPPTHDYVFGVAILDSAGTGVAVLSYNDAHCYLATITTWSYSSFTGNVAQFGHDAGSGAAGASPIAMRLVRATNTFTGYVSGDGNNWFSGAAGSFDVTLTSTFTAAYAGVGLFKDLSNGYRGRLYCDWFHKV